MQRAELPNVVLRHKSQRRHRRLFMQEERCRIINTGQKDYLHWIKANLCWDSYKGVAKNVLRPARLPNRKVAKILS
jgi:hypothetical protein